MSQPHLRPLLACLALLPCLVLAQPVTPTQARDDVLTAIGVAEAALPDLYWHQTPADWEAAKARALNDAKAADDAMDVQVAVARLMVHVGEGHLDVLPSQAARVQQRATASVLPLDLHWSTEGVFVSAVHGAHPGPPVGARLLSINGEAVPTLLAELLSVSTRDGRIATGAMRECEGSCYAILRQRIRGNESVFDVRYQDPDGATHARRLPPHPMRELPPPPPRERRIATLEWVEPRVAYLEVSTFSNRVYREAGTTFPAVIRSLFEEIERQGADRLILDLRENGGGSEPNEAILFSHLVAEPLRRYRSVEARGRTLSAASPGGDLLTYEVFDAEEMALQRSEGGRLFRRDLPPEGLQSHWSRATPVFDGTLVVLVSGRTFSGGAELASMLHHVRRGRFVGEETGGTYEGNTSGYRWEVTLPHSGVELSMPVLKFRFDWEGPLPGRGVLPDCDVPPRVGDRGEHRDRAWRIAHAWAEHPEQPHCPSPGAEDIGVPASDRSAPSPC